MSCLHHVPAFTTDECVFKVHLLQDAGLTARGCMGTGYSKHQRNTDTDTHTLHVCTQLMSCVCVCTRESVCV